MKKLISFMLVIFSAFSFIGCLKSDELEENKIKAPAPSSISVEGVWEIVEQYKVKENNELEKSNNIEKPLISISATKATIQQMEIDNPNFKFKKVNEEEYLPKEFKSVIKNIKVESKMINIISISDSTNLYVDFIKENDDKAYIYTVGELLVVQKVAEGTKKEATEKINSDITNLENKKGQDSGVLIGIKEPGTFFENGKLKSKASYKTIWIYSKEGVVQSPKVIDGLLLPRMNGSFSDINMKDTVINNENVQTLSVVNQNKSGKTEESKDSANELYREITYVGKDYIGLQYYNSNVNNYKIIPVDSIENNKGLKLEDIYGNKGIEAYANSREKFISMQDDEDFENKYNLDNADMGNITMLRKNGKWMVAGQLDSRVAAVNDLDFDIDISTNGALVNWDSLPVAWNKILEFASNARDAISSPLNDFMVVLNNNNIEVYNIKNIESKGAPLLTYPITKNSLVVMSEWATGNDFVTSWNNVVDSKIN